MELTIPLPERIGTGVGPRRDGQFGLGSVAHINFDKSYLRGHAHGIDAAIRAQGGVFTALTAAINDDAVNDVTVFTTAAVTGDAFYVRIEDDESFVDTVRIDAIMGQAGVGTFAYAIEYNGPSGWTAVSSPTNATFLKSSGKQSFSFTKPADWQEDFVGTADLPRSHWVRFRITSGTVTTAPLITRAYEVHSTPTNIDLTAGGQNVSIDKAGSYIVTGDTQDEFCHVTAEKPFVMEVIYEAAQIGGGNDVTYSVAGGAYQTMPGVEDDSGEQMNQNSVTQTHRRLTGTAVSAEATTVQGLVSDGYIAATPNALPTAGTNRYAIGLALTPGGVIEFELRANFVGGNPRYEVFESGVSRYQHTADINIAHEARVMRFEQTLYYVVDGQVIYTSATTNSDDVLFGRVSGVDNGVVVTRIKLVDWRLLLATPLTITWQSVATFTDSAEAQTTEQYLGRYRMRFNPPADFASHTVAQSKVGTAGYHICVRKTGVAGAVTSTITPMLFRALTLTSPLNAGVTIGNSKTIGRMTLVAQDPDEIAQDLSLMVINAATGAFLFATFAAATLRASGVQTVDIADIQAQSIIGIVNGGQDEVDIGSPSYLLLTE